MTSQQEAIENLEARANAVLAHMGDIEYIVAHKDQLNALMLLQAMSDDSPELEHVKATSLGGVKDALKHGENALLVWAFATRQQEVFSNPGLYTTTLCAFALAELNGESMPLKEFPYPDVWALSALIGTHYEPVPYAPFTREQLVKVMEEEREE